MAQMLKKICSDKTGKQINEYYCDKCDYYCNKIFLWKQHIVTKKHLKKTLSSNAQKDMPNMLTHVCSCGKKYQHVQSYKRHQKSCSVGKYQVVALDNEKAELRNMITTLIKQNQTMLSENTEMRELLKDVIPKIGNTTITNKFNLQFFLNEQCKDAINLTEFVDTLSLEVTDLDETRENGYITGISNIIVRGLKELDLHKRPIHCSDLKREVLYVKENDTWEKDNDDKEKMKHVITSVAKKQIDKIKEWESENPNWNQTDNGTQKYIDMVKELTGSQGEEDKSNNRIIKTIAKEVIIEK